MQKKIDASILRQSQEDRSTDGRFGVIQSYDPYTNTATVLLSAPDSFSTGDLITGVLCPVTIGVQTVAPEPGRPAWIMFKGRNDKMAVISHYFNHNYETYDYVRMTKASSGIPRYTLGL